MDTMDLYAEAWAGVRKSYEADRLAHAYIIVGSVRGNALQFTEAILKLLFCQQDGDRPCHACEGCRRVERHQHSDVMWIEPRNKSRQVSADDIRDLIKRMSQTAHEGGWKVGVISSADRLNLNSANILLKTLEEPPPRSLLLLLTDSISSLLPTVISRCQKLVLSGGRDYAAEQLWKGALTQMLQEFPPDSGLDAARLAGRLRLILAEIKGHISNEVEMQIASEKNSLDELTYKEVLDARIGARLKEVQGEIFLYVQNWCRDLLMLASGISADKLVFSEYEEVLRAQSACYTPSAAVATVEAVERMAKRLDRNIPPAQVFDEGFRRLIIR